MKAVFLALAFIVSGGSILHAQSAPSARGRVTTLNGTPMPGVRVSVTRQGTDGIPDQAAVKETDEKGDFIFEGLAAGTYTFSAERSGTPGAFVGVRPGELGILGKEAPAPQNGYWVVSTTPSRIMSPGWAIRLVRFLPPPVLVTLQTDAATFVDFFHLPVSRRLGGRVVRAPELRSTEPLVVTAEESRLGFRTSVEVQADGTFEFPQLPQGTFVLRLVPNRGIPATTVTLADRDVTGVELPGAPLARVSGVLPSATQRPEDGAFPDLAYLIPQDAVDVSIPEWTSANSRRWKESTAEDRALLATGTIVDRVGERRDLPTASVDKEGRFEYLGVPPGTYTLRTAPEIGLWNMTIAVTDKDATDIEAGPGARVRGSVVASNFGGRVPEMISLTATAPRGQSRTTPIAADGSFDFSNVGPGVYRVLVDGKIHPEPGEITIGTEDTVLTVAVPFYSWVSGRVTFTGGRPPEDAIGLHIALSNGAVADVMPDGAFRVGAADGSYKLFVRDLPEECAVMSMFNGVEDLLAERVKVDASVPALEILISLECAQNR